MTFIINNAIINERKGAADRRLVPELITIKKITA